MLAAWAAAILLAVSGCGSRPRASNADAGPPHRRGPFEKLSQYALFAGDPAAQQPAEGVIPYDLNSALFSDYAEKFRFIKLPAGHACALTSDDDVFEFPVGTVIAKTFAFPHDARDPSQGPPADRDPDPRSTSPTAGSACPMSGTTSRPRPRSTSPATRST